MKIQILGTGCPKCKTLAANAEAAVAALGVDAEIVKVTQINDIMSFGVMMTPALSVARRLWYTSSGGTCSWWLTSSAPWLAATCLPVR